MTSTLIALAAALGGAAIPQDPDMITIPDDPFAVAPYEPSEVQPAQQGVSVTAPAAKGQGGLTKITTQGTAAPAVSRVTTQGSDERIRELTKRIAELTRELERLVQERASGRAPGAAVAPRTWVTPKVDVETFKWDENQMKLFREQMEKSRVEMDKAFKDMKVYQLDEKAHREMLEQLRKEMGNTKAFQWDEKAHREMMEKLRKDMGDMKVYQLDEKAHKEMMENLRKSFPQTNRVSPGETRVFVTPPTGSVTLEQSRRLRDQARRELEQKLRPADPARDREVESLRQRVRALEQQLKARESEIQRLKQSQKKEPPKVEVKSKKISA